MRELLEVSTGSSAVPSTGIGERARLLATQTTDELLVDH